MHIFRSLTAKYSFIALIILSFIGVFSYASFEFTSHMTGEAAAINLAGQLRFRVFQMAWYGQRLAEEVDSRKSRAALQAELVQRIEAYDEIINDLRTGSRDLKNKPIVNYRKGQDLFESLAAQWERDLRPGLRKLAVLPLSAPEAEARLVLQDFDAAVPRFVQDADAFVKALVIDSNEDIEQFDRVICFILCGFLVAAVFIVLYMRKTIVLPVKGLITALREVERGNLSVRVKTIGEGEIKELAQGFNETARALDIVVDENVRLSRINKALYDASQSIMTDLRINTLLETIVQEAQRLINTKYAAIGILDDAGNYEHYVPVGIDPETFARMMAQHGLPRGEGLLGHLLKEGKPVRLDNIAQHPASVGFPTGHPAMKTFLGVPVLMQGRVIGRLYFADKLDNSPFSPDDEHLALSLANTAALAINNARLLHAVVARNEELDVLSSITKATSRSLDLDVMFQKVLDTILGLAPLKLEKKGAIFLRDEETKRLKLVASSNFSDEQNNGCSLISVGECLCGLCAETKEVVLSDNNHADERHTKIYPDAIEHGHVILPLKSRDKMLGVLCLYLSAGMKPADAEMRLYASIADILSIYLHNALSQRQTTLLAQALDSSIDLIVITDKKGKITYTNPPVERYLGYTQEEIKGKLISITRSPNNRPGLGREIFKKTIEGGWEGELINIRENGSEYPMLLTTAPIRDEKGDIIALIGIGRDITSYKAATEALRVSAERLRLAVSAANFGLWDWDLRTDQVYFSPEWKGQIGYADHELANDFAEWRKRLHPDDLERVLEQNKRSRQEPWPDYNAVFRFQHKDGSYRWIMAQGAVLRGEDGQPYRMIGSHLDITERKNAEERIRKGNKELLALADASNVVLTTTTTTENILRETICDLAISCFGLRMAWLGLIEQNSFAIKPVSYAGFEDGYLTDAKFSWDNSLTGMGPTGMAVKTLQSQVVNDRELDPRYTPWKGQAQQRGYHSSMAAPLVSADGTVLGVLNLYSGEMGYFTAERVKLFTVFANQAATALENVRLIEGLEAKVRERTTELEDAILRLRALNVEYKMKKEEADELKLQAEEANRAKSEFLANMSHELRTPLNSIIGFSEIMSDGMAGPVTEEQKEYLGNVLTSGRHLLQLINEILDLSKVEAGKMELELGEMSVQEVLVGSLIMVKEKAMKHRLTLSTEIPPDMGAIIADERKIRQVVYNLLSNAVKFTLDGGEVGLKAERMPGKVRVTVWDTGIGIKAGDLGKLFAPFKQIDSKLSRMFQGTGLGLNLSKKLVELHGGRIWVESEYEKGSRFIFDVPAEPYPPLPADPIAYESVTDPEAPEAPTPRLLRRQFFLDYLEKVAAYHKRHGLGFGVARFFLKGRNAQEAFAPAASALRDLARNEEVLGRGDDPGTFDMVLMNVDRQQAETASGRLQDRLRERLRERLRNAGLIIDAKLAVYPEDGQDGATLLRTLMKA